MQLYCENTKDSDNLLFDVMKYVRKAFIHDESRCRMGCYFDSFCNVVYARERPQWTVMFA